MYRNLRSLLISRYFGFTVAAIGLFAHAAGVRAESVTASPASCISATGVGTRAWSNPGSATASDNTYATASVNSSNGSNYLQCTGFGFAIPTGATISGLVVTVERKTSGGTVTDSRVRLIKGGTIGLTDRATTTAYTNSDVAEAHGGTSDLWGATWAPADLNSAGFGVAYAAQSSGSTTNRTVSVDQIQVTVEYSLPFVCAPPNNIPAALIGNLTCYCDSFNRSGLNPSPSMFNANWLISASDGSGILPSVVTPGYLRLTNNSTNNAKAATAPGIYPAAGNYISVEFRHYAYNGSSPGADGMAVILSDYTVAPVPGASGGSLGYAQKTGVNGFAGGWLGVALDEWGNYQNPTEGRVGGPGFRAQSVGARGSGSGTTGYRWFGGTTGLTPNIDNPGATAPSPGSFYQIVIDARNEPGTTSVSVNRDTTSGVGGAYVPLISIPNVYSAAAAQGFTQAPVPNNWQISFTGSTGASTNIHEIGSVRICAQTVWPPGGGTADGFSAIDEAYGNAGGTPKPDVQSYLAGHIYTKLMGLPFKLNVAAIGNDQIQTGYAISSSKYVQLKLVDNRDEVCKLDNTDPQYCNADCVAKPAIADGAQTLTFNSTKGGQLRTADITLNTAYRKLVAVLRECTTSACSAFTATPPACSTDAFSVRPLAVSSVVSAAVPAGANNAATNTGTSGTPRFKAGADPFALTAVVAGIAGKANGYTGTLKIDNNGLQAIAPATVAGRVTPGSPNSGFPAAVSATETATATNTIFTYDEVGAFRLLGFDPAVNATSARGVFDGVMSAGECAGLSAADCDVLRAATWTGVDSVSTKGDCIADNFANSADLSGSFATNPNFGKYGCNFGLFNPIAPNSPNSPVFGRFIPDHFTINLVRLQSRSELATCYPARPAGTLGTIRATTDQLTVADATGMAVGDRLLVFGADRGGSDLIATIQSLAGNRLTLSQKAATDVTDTPVFEVDGLAGTISAGSSLLTVANAAGVTAGDRLAVFGAGGGGGVLATTVASVAGNALTLTAAAATSVANAPVFVATGFTYMDEPLHLDLALSANSAGGGKTMNYAGTLATLDASSLTGLGGNTWGLWGSVENVYGVAGCRAVFDQSSGFNTRYLGSACTGLPASAPTAPYPAAAARVAPSNPVALNWNYGTVRLATDLSLKRATVADGAFDTVTGVFALGIRPTDSDGVTLGTAVNLDADSGSGPERNAIAIADFRYGRLRLSSGYGSELLPVRLPISADYFAANRGVWQVNGDDSCTPITSGNIAIGNCSGGISPCSGIGKSLTASPLAAGKTTLILRSPNQQGTADVAINLGGLSADGSCNSAHPASSGDNQPWLRFDWCKGSADPNSGDPSNDPNARVRFGSPRAAHIYLRERY